MVKTTESKMNRGELNGNLEIRNFALAGRATLTVENERSGGRFTFEVSAPTVETEAGGKVRNLEARVRFVKVLTGPDNSADFTFLGTIFDGVTYRRSPKSRISEDAPTARAWAWFWGCLTSGTELPDFVKVYHEGRCGRCGRKLTVPESIISGYGPECLGKVAA